MEIIKGVAGFTNYFTNLSLPHEKDFPFVTDINAICSRLICSSTGLSSLRVVNYWMMCLGVDKLKRVMKQQLSHFVSVFGTFSMYKDKRL